jgi:hypothetical protein
MSITYLIAKPVNVMLKVLVNIRHKRATHGKKLNS